MRTCSAIHGMFLCQSSDWNLPGLRRMFVKRKAGPARIMQRLLQDISYSLRSLQKTPGFTAMGIVSLALGIAANTVVFTIVNTTLLRPLPYTRPDRLVILTWYGPHGRLTKDISASAFFMLKERARSFESIAATHKVDAGVNVAAMGTPQYKKAGRVSLDYFRTLGASPILGREF